MKRPILIRDFYKGSQEYSCEITKCIDTFIPANRKFFTKNELSKRETESYIFLPASSFKDAFKKSDSLGLPKKPREDALLPIRIPGMTVGHVTVSKQRVVKGIKLYDDAIRYFDLKVDQNKLDKFIGRDVVILDSKYSLSIINTKTKRACSPMLKRIQEDFISSKGLVFYDMSKPIVENGIVTYDIRFDFGDYITTIGKVHFKTKPLRLYKISFKKDLCINIADLEKIINNDIDREIKIYGGTTYVRK